VEGEYIELYRDSPKITEMDYASVGVAGVAYKWALYEIYLSEAFYSVSGS
jgi:hypothetical protein